MSPWYSCANIVYIHLWRLYTQYAKYFQLNITFLGQTKSAPNTLKFQKKKKTYLRNFYVQ